MKRREFFMAVVAWLTPLVTLGRWTLVWKAPYVVGFKLTELNPSMYGRLVLQQTPMMSKGYWKWMRLKRR
jgi:hypothetical protein